MIDYEYGLNALKECLPEEALAEFDVQEARLKDNLKHERLFGGSDVTRSNRAEIIYALNLLARTYCSKSFNDLCNRSPSRGPFASPSPRISVELLTRMVPTVYCYNKEASDFPLVTVTIDNTAPASTPLNIQVSATIENYGVDVKKLSVASQEQVNEPLLPRLRPAVFSTLNNIVPATLRVLVEKITPSRDVLYDNTWPIHLYARNTVLLAQKKQDGSMLDLSDSLAAWVTPHHPEIDKMLLKAKKHHPKQEFIGYRANTTQDAALVVREQAQAFFDALTQNLDLVYVKDTFEPAITDEQVTQRVRFPSEILASGGPFNCLDGSLLFASLLAAVSIEPLVILVQHHAYVGWRIWPDVPQYEYLETTSLGKDDFTTAQDVAKGDVDRALIKGYHMKPLFDAGGFARTIDVAACWKKGIFSLE